MVQWLRLYLSMQRVWLWSPDGELRCHMPCPSPPKNNLKQKQYCNKVNTKPLKMVHIKKKKKSLSEPHLHYYPLSSESPASPDCLSFPEDCIYFHTSMRGFNSSTLSSKWSEVAQSCPTLCDPMDCRLPGSTVHGIFQARILEWLPFPSPTLSSRVTLITTTLTLIPETMLILLLFALL